MLMSVTIDNSADFIVSLSLILAKPSRLDCNRYILLIAWLSLMWTTLG